MKNRVLSDNKGFSLLELIVAVLIMGIISGVGIMAFSLVDRTNPEAVAKKVADGMKQVRINAMALENNQTKVADGKYKTEVYAKFYKKNSDIYIDICTNYSDTEKALATSKLSSDEKRLLFKDQDGNLLGTVGADSTVVKVFFKKSTGGISGIMVGTDFKDTNLSQITVTGKTSDTYATDLIVVNVTGRCYLDD